MEQLQNTVQQFVREHARERRDLLCPTASFRRAFQLHAATCASTQMLALVMEQLGFPRHYIQRYDQQGKSRLTGVYLGLELQCFVPTAPKRKRKPRTKPVETREAVTQTESVSRMDWYEKDVMPVMLAKWRQQFTDTLRTTCATHHIDGSTRLPASSGCTLP